MDTDSAYPTLTPFKEQAVARWAAADFDRGAVDWGGAGEARQWLANAEWSRQNDATHAERLRCAADVGFGHVAWHVHRWRRALPRLLPSFCLL